MSANLPNPIDKDVVILGLTTAVSSLMEQLDSSAAESGEKSRQLTQAAQVIADLERQLAVKGEEIATAIAEKHEALRGAAAARKITTQLEAFLEELGVDVGEVRDGGLWATFGAKVLKVVYDPTREPSGMTDVLRLTAQRIAIDRRPPQAD